MDSRRLRCRGRTVHRCRSGGARDVDRALHPFAIDYIKQAPLLVVALAQDNDLAIKKERLRVANQFIIACSGQPRLADMMRECGVAPQLRNLSGQALRRRDWHTLKRLSTVAPSTLAQSVPRVPSEQRSWLDALDIWKRQLGHHFRNAGMYFAWVAANLRTMPNDMTMTNVADIADFAGNNRERFNENWMLLQAKAASDRWHVEVARRAAEATLLTKNKIGWKDQADYGPLPTHDEVNGFEFAALVTAEDIFVEGQLMHHCVSTYTPRVMRGKTYLFSIRRAGRRVATLV